MRVFVALDIPDDVRREIAEFAAKLKGAWPQARWTRVEGMHVTLKFIGEASPEKVERIRAALAEVRSSGNVEMNFRGVGFFPNDRRPRVFWVGIEATPNLGELAAEVEGRMEVLGLPREQRPFRPHLTLARFHPGDKLNGLAASLAPLGPFEFGATRTGELHLYQSQLRPQGAIYTRLATYSFVSSTAGAQ